MGIYSLWTPFDFGNIPCTCCKASQVGAWHRLKTSKSRCKDLENKILWHFNMSLSLPQNNMPSTILKHNILKYSSKKFNAVANDFYLCHFTLLLSTQMSKTFAQKNWPMFAFSFEVHKINYELWSSDFPKVLLWNASKFPHARGSPSETKQRKRNFCRLASLDLLAGLVHSLKGPGTNQIPQKFLINDRLTYNHGPSWHARQYTINGLSYLQTVQLQSIWLVSELRSCKKARETRKRIENKAYFCFCLAMNQNPTNCSSLTKKSASSTRGIASLKIIRHILTMKFRFLDRKLQSTDDESTHKVGVLLCSTHIIIKY